MKKKRLPDFDFHNVAYGKLETHWSLLPLLYSGGAGENARLVAEKINAGAFGKPILKRLSAIRCIYDFICGELEAGRSKHTVIKSIRELRQLYSWGDRNDRPLTQKSLEADFLEWANHLRHRSEVAHEIKSNTAYSALKIVSRLIANSFDSSGGDKPVSSSSNLIASTGMSRTKRSRKALNAEEEQTLIANLFSFGEYLLDLSTALTTAAIRSEDPIEVTFRSGKSMKIRTAPRSKSRAAWNQGTITSDCEPDANGIRRLRPACDQNRYPLVNLRISAELLIFIAQTGMNLSQAAKLRAAGFSYRSHTDGYEVHRVYKNRRSGEVAFSIYREYRPIFENYLAWRRQLFPSSQSDNDYLFPFWQSPRRVSLAPPYFTSIKRRCSTLGIRYFGPQALRLLRTNWLLKNSHDTALVAELAQHSERTLTETYERPSLRTVSLEVSQFHATWEPVLLAPAPGVCAHPVPKLLASTPSDAPRPDCISPAGCLFCTHHRDIESADHVWSLASYRHLKSLELAAYGDSHQAGKPNPAATAISFISRKLEEFRKIDPSQSSWVDEALSRVAEEDFHPRWEGFIRLMEISHEE